MTGREPGDASERVERTGAQLERAREEALAGVVARRARRADVASIAALVGKATDSRLDMDEPDVMEWLFGKGVWVAELNGELVGVAGWQAENLLAVTDVFHVHPRQCLDSATAALLSTIEAEANTLMCEANVITLASDGENLRACVLDHGYEPASYDELHRIWREVLDGFAAADHDLLVKRLRDRMIMVPI